MSWFLYIIGAMLVFIVGRWLLRGGILIVALIIGEIMDNLRRRKARRRYSPTPGFKFKYLFPRKK